MRPKYFFLYSPYLLVLLFIVNSVKCKQIQNEKVTIASESSESTTSASTSQDITSTFATSTITESDTQTTELVASDQSVLISELKDIIRNVEDKILPVVENLNSILTDEKVNNDLKNTSIENQSPTEEPINRVSLHSLEDKVITVTPSNIILSEFPTTQAQEESSTYLSSTNDLETTTPTISSSEKDDALDNPIYGNIAKLLSSLNEQQLKEFYSSLTKSSAKTSTSESTTVENQVTTESVSKATESSRSSLSISDDLKNFVKNKTADLKNSLKKIKEDVKKEVNEIYNIFTTTESDDYLINNSTGDSTISTTASELTTITTTDSTTLDILTSTTVDDSKSETTISNELKQLIVVEDVENATTKTSDPTSTTESVITDLRKLTNKTIEEISPIIEDLKDVLHQLKGDEGTQNKTETSSEVVSQDTTTIGSVPEVTTKIVLSPFPSNRYNNRRNYGRNPVMDLNTYRNAYEDGVLINKDTNQLSQDSSNSVRRPQRPLLNRFGPRSNTYDRSRGRSDEESKVITVNVPPNSDLSDIMNVKNSIVYETTTDDKVSDEMKSKARRILKTLKQEIEKAESTESANFEKEQRLKEWRRGRVRYQNAVPLLSEEREFDGKGYYKFSYESADGINANEEGYLKTFDSGESGEVVVGSYSWTDADGKTYKVDYTADENGFRPRGAHLPTPPPLPAYLRGASEGRARHRDVSRISRGSKKFQRTDYNEFK